MHSLTLFAADALLPEGWARDVRLHIDGDGTLLEVTPEASSAGAERLSGPAVPGVPNLHSHAFQRALAGRGERAGSSVDSFWTWRETMYRLVARITPDTLQAIAAQLYVEMLKVGFTSVAEFHYLHHDPDGRPYADPVEMSRRLVAAAEVSGIGLTLLPVLYGYGNFGGSPPGEGQRRFLCDPERLLGIVEALLRTEGRSGQRRIGLAPHSLRAVTPDSLGAALSGLDALDPGAPLHIHVAEQEREVADCLAWSGRRPVEWLVETMEGLSTRWCLVHATHTPEAELGAVAESGAVAGLCPTTEANLGDGLFPGPSYLAAGGLFGLGSDSNTSVSPWEELRWLEYGQRLRDRRRNVLRVEATAHIGAGLFRGALRGGARALGRPVGRLAAGCRADLLVIDADSPFLTGSIGDELLDAAVFAGNANPVRDVMVGGRWQVRDGHHRDESAVAAAFRNAVAALGA